MKRAALVLAVLCAAVAACMNFDRDLEACKADGGPCARYDADASVEDSGVIVAVCRDGTECREGSCANGCCDATCAGVAQLALGDFFTCARMTDGRAKCWGANDFGQLGTPDGGHVTIPQDVPGLSNLAQIAAGGEFACGIFLDGGVSCWGNNSNGQLGRGSDAGWSSDPAPVAGLVDARQLALGYNHACALTGDRRVWCWGENVFGELGDGTHQDQGTPVRVCNSGSGGSCSPTGSVREIVAAAYLTCARYPETDPYVVKCWGRSQSGELGTYLLNSPNPVGVAGVPSAASQLSTGGGHVCAVASGQVWCWGRNATGNGDYVLLGRGDSDAGSSPTPAPVCTAVTDAGCTPLTGVDEVAVGNLVACARKGNAAWCWGDNFWPSLATTQAIPYSPVAIPADQPTPLGIQALQTDVAHLAAGEEHVCAQTKTMGAICWGANDVGQLGNGTDTTAAFGDPSSPKW